MDTVLNSVGFPEVISEIGDQGIARLNDLRRWIYDDSLELQDVGQPHMAPSIITRSEAELFNMSIPRFAIRMYLDKDGSSLVNVRRISTFCTQFRPWAERTTVRTERNPNLRVKRFFKFRHVLKSTSWILRDNPCIGDCVLKVPERMKKFHILGTNLGYIYGEEKDIWGVPYMRHIDLAGGGLCAQATCFMGMVLLKEYANSIYGIAEITSTSQNKWPRELILQGLCHDGMSRCLSSPMTSLSAVWQRPSMRIKAREVDCFAQLIRAYLLSGFPVILPIDLGRAAGHDNVDCPLECDKSILYNNLYSPGSIELDLKFKPEQFDGRKPQTHAIILIGCGFESEKDTFIYNDPSILPFMKASVIELSDARCYASPEMEKLGYHLLLPITPRDVCLPLGPWYTADEMSPEFQGEPRPHIGLLRIAEPLLTSAVEPNFPVLKSIYELGVLRLWKPDLARQAGSEGYSNDPEGAELLSITPFREYFQRLNNWCWVQYSNKCLVGKEEAEAIWIWDAQKHPPEGNRCSIDISRSFLLGLFVKRNSQWKQIYGASQRPTTINSEDLSDNSPTDKMKSNAGDHTCEIKIKGALLSSFDAVSLENAVKNWPEDTVKHCDLYAFMQSDADTFLDCTVSLWPTWIRQFLGHTVLGHVQNFIRRKGNKRSVGVTNPVLSARVRMASLWKRTKKISDVAGNINEICAQKDLKIIALSSFIPGLASKSGLEKRSQQALLFLVRLAGELRNLDHPVKIVEFVAGSLIDGIWPAKHKYKIRGKTYASEKVYVANVSSSCQAIDYLIRNIRCVAEEAAKIKVPLVIELEPGPLFVVNDASTLCILCHELRRDSLLSTTIGFNLDIAHWSLAGMNARQLFGNGDIPTSVGTCQFNFECIRDRVLHCHVSGFSKGHFADIEPNNMDNPENFTRWIKEFGFFADNRKRENGSQSHGGFFSIELEAASSLGIVKRSLDFCMPWDRDASD